MVASRSLRKVVVNKQKYNSLNRITPAIFWYAVQMRSSGSAHLLGSLVSFFEVLSAEQLTLGARQFVVYRREQDAALVLYIQLVSEALHKGVHSWLNVRAHAHSLPLTAALTVTKFSA